MARYKGRTSTKNIESDFPHIMEIAVPLGGLGQQLNQMYGWHRERGVEVHRRKPPPTLPLRSVA